MSLALVAAWVAKIGGFAYLVERVCALVTAALQKESK